jgi:precorrin-6y C5,15-methyltransferase (decarboxylating) CbiE subunit
MAKNMTETFHPIVIAGCGPGGPEYVTPLARQAAVDAQVLVGAGRLFDLFPESAAERIIVTGDIEGVLDEIEAVFRIKRVVVLVTGDPGLMSLAAPVIHRFGRENCRVIPGISTLQVACARLGLDWQDLRIIDAHGSDPDVEPGDLRGTEKIAVFTGRDFSWILRLMETLGNDYRIYWCENLTLTDEKVRKLDVTELMQKDISSLSIVLLIKETRA